MGGLPEKGGRAHVRTETQAMMRVAWIGLAVLFQISSAARCQEGSKRAGAFTNYFGYSNCVRLENDDTRVVLCPEAGGRVLQYSWKGKNALYLDPAQTGWLYEPGKPVVEPCGGRFDIGPEMVVPRHPDLWFGKWLAEITGPRAARLTSVKDKATGVQLVREFALDGASSRLTCTQTIRNVCDKQVPWCHFPERALGVKGLLVKFFAYSDR